jgi:hypothetical protein
MTANDCIEGLERARGALDEYYRACDRAFNGVHNELGVEARKRIGQMIWLLSEIGRLLSVAEEAQAQERELLVLLRSQQITQDEWHERMRSPGLAQASATLAGVFEPLETLTESFYWIAARARAVIRELPHLSNFEAEGVRNTRNKLLEHPKKKDSGVFITSFAWGADHGPVIKGLRYESQTEIWPDKGLFINATEFADELCAKAARARPRIAIKL